MNTFKFITILNNAIQINKIKIIVVYSKKTVPLLKVLCEELYILSYKKISNLKILIFLNQTYKKNRIHLLKPVSKPSKSIYISHNELWALKNTISTLILSTSKGVITHKSALTNFCGGKVICLVR
jgi:small subunit ribosomal protein S8